ncbi:MAG: peptidylprolyl isomerase [Robiginitomaculum sp.]|nr:MAG: peptidylprolyl isomerase [Robiginitomaculum sp.]
MRITKGTRLTIMALFSPVFLGAILIGCQDKNTVENEVAFTPNVGRLGDAIIADVDGTHIYVSDIEHAALAKGLIQPGTSLGPTDPLFQTTLDALIDQRLLALEAMRRSLDQNDETRKRLLVARERILSNVVIETLLAEKVTDEAIRRLYDEQTAMQTGGEQVWARDILVASEDKAKEIALLLENGGNFTTLAKEFSLDQSTRDLGGSLGWFSRNALRGDLAKTAFETPRGTVSVPFKDAFGWHVLKVEGRRPTPRPKFEDIKAEITNYLTYDEIENLLKSLRSNSEISLKLVGKTPEEIGVKTED